MESYKQIYTCFITWRLDKRLDDMINVNIIHLMDDAQLQKLAQQYRVIERIVKATESSCQQGAYC